jgi:Carboxypeptidase regulatory-like domain/TonB dependent receptor/TonB-dependent Receptor Plug Domain
LLSPKRFASLFIFFTLIAASGWAQVTTATLSGTITDANDAVVPGATVSLHNSATGLVRTGKTDSVGDYAFEFLPVGTYSLRIEQTGFASIDQSGIVLTAAEQQRLDFKLKAGQVSTTVNVTSEDAMMLDTSTPAQNVQLDATTLNQLPVAKQDWTSILQLGAGISTDNAASAPAGASLSINGLPPAGFNLTVDGTNATSDPETPAFGFYQGPNIINTINNDAIAEVSVVKGIAPATIGGTMSGNVNIITKSGTNSFHGSLYEISELNAYDARNPFLTSKPRTTFNEYGGSIGGPIWKNKAFFFGSYEGARLSSYSPVTDTVPTPYFLSQAPAVYDPVLSKYPTVSQPAGDPTALTTQYFGAASLRQTDGNGVARIDYNPNQNNLLYVRYIRSRPYKLAPTVIAINDRATTGHTDAFNVAYTHVSNSWVALSRFGYNRIRLQRLDQGFGSDLEELKVVGVDSEGSEQFVKSGEFYTGEQQFARTFGRHPVTVGAIVQRQNAGRTDYNTATIGYGSFADFQTNTPNTIVITFDLSPFTLYSYQFGGFLQDDIKWNSHLTMNVGLRYDYFTVVKEENGRVFNRGVNSAVPELGAGFGPYRAADSMYNGDFNNFQPRVGFAYNVGSNSDTVIRGGAGLFVSPHPIFGGPIDEVQDSASEPFRITLTGNQAASSGLAYPLPRSGYQAALAQLQNSGVISTQIVNTSINGDFPDPYSIQWTLGVEQQLPLKHRIEIDYVGNRGLKENMTITKNLPDRVTGNIPYPTFPQFRFYYAGDASNYHGMQVQLVKAPWHGLSYGLTYAWSRAMAFEEANLLLQDNPQDNDKIRADYGVTPFDIRNRFSINFLYETQFSKALGIDNRAGKLLFDGWQVSGIFKEHTGLPYNILNGSSSYPSDRPDFVSSSYYLPINALQHQYLNPAAFAAVPISSASSAQIRGGTLARDAVRLPRVTQLDASLGKNFGITDTVKFQLRADAFDVLNHQVYNSIVTNYASSTFGQLTAATSRTMQISGRITF